MQWIQNFLKRSSRSASLLIMLALSAASLPSAFALVSRQYAVEVSATVQSSPAQIRLSWPSDPNGGSYTVSRKAQTDGSWGSPISLGSGVTSYTDYNVSVGSAYEYKVSKSAASHSGYGYVLAGIEAPMIDSRGKMILLVDNTYSAELAPELTQMEQDLVGDGWIVIRRDVGRSASAVEVKNVIRSVYNTDPSQVKAVFIFGHVAVPYSGNFNPDGHEDHVGAWPADSYYGDMDGNWTDSSVNNTSSPRAATRNVPGDGKFDQNTLPSDLELQVGRVDLFNMTCFANKTPSRNERDLLRQYLNKDHNFRHRVINPQRRGLIVDNFGDFSGEAFAANGFRNFSAFFGSQNVIEAGGWSYFPTLSSQSYLWSYGCGGGGYYTCNGIGSSDDFALNDIQTVFTMFLGSYFGDWDNESNFLRAPLGSTSHALTAVWAGRPNWFFHHMGLGEHIGYSSKISQNNSGTYPFAGFYGVRGIHAGFLGDPTLRMHIVVPPSNLRVTTNASSFSLSWSASTDTSIRGYHVYRASTPAGPYTRLTASPINSTTYSDDVSGSYTHMVRAVKLESSGSGTYLNPSQGVFSSAGGSTGGGGGGGGITAPNAPSAISAVVVSPTQVNLNWRDNADNESGYKVERKTGASGTYAQVATLSANATSYNNSGLVSGTTYFFRVRSANSGGDSAYSAEVSATPNVANPTTPAAVFIRADNNTKGSWKNVYGSDGYNVLGNAVSYPSYVQVASSGNYAYEWNSSTTDPVALQKIPGPDRLLHCWYSSTTFNVDLTFNDANFHQVAFYCLDWSTTTRQQKVEILDAGTGTVLSSQTISSFSGGRYLIWDLRGNVRVRFTRVAGDNAVLMGMFFGPAVTQNQQGTRPVAITSFRPGTDGKFRLQLAGEISQRFSIQYTTDLRNWVPLTTTTMTGTTMEYIDPSTNQGVTRFYRTVLAP